MFNTIIRASLSHRLFVLIGAIALMIYGLATLRQLPVDVFPDLNRPTVTLIAEVEGLAPEEVELLVTYPDRDGDERHAGRDARALGLGRRAVDRLRRVRLVDRKSTAPASRSPSACSSCASSFPSNVAAQMGPISSVMGEIMLIAMSSTTVDPMTLRELADFTVRPQLLTVPGVSQVIPIGGEVRQYRVVPDPRRMASLNVSFEAIENAHPAVRRQHRRRLRRPQGARVSDPQHRPHDQDRGSAQSRRCLSRGARHLAEPGGRRRFRRRAPSAATRDSTASRRVILAVQKQPDADTVSITRQIEAMLPELQRVMPDGVRITDIQFRQATFIETSIDNLSARARRGAGLRRHRAVRVPAQLADDLHLADRHPAVGAHHPHRLPAHGAVDQHHDAGRAGHRHRRARRRRRRRRREHLSPARVCTGQPRAATGAAFSRSSRRPPPRCAPASSTPRSSSCSCSCRSLRCRASKAGCSRRSASPSSCRSLPACSYR